MQFNLKNDTIAEQRGHHFYMFHRDGSKWIWQDHDHVLFLQVRIGYNTQRDVIPCFFIIMAQSPGSWVVEGSAGANTIWNLSVETALSLCIAQQRATVSTIRSVSLPVLRGWTAFVDITLQRQRLYVAATESNSADPALPVATWAQFAATMRFSAEPGATSAKRLLCREGFHGNTLKIPPVKKDRDKFSPSHLGRHSQKSSKYPDPIEIF